MLQKTVLAIAVFFIILLALTFGEGVATQLLAWISHLTGLVLYNFTDIAIAIKTYVQAHSSKVILAVILTIPVCLCYGGAPKGISKTAASIEKLTSSWHFALVGWARIATT